MVEQIKNSMKEKIKRLIELPYVLKFFLVFSSFFGVLMIKTIPPLQAPDEIGHYVKAEAFSDFKIRPREKSSTSSKKGNSTWGEYGFKVSSEIYKMNEYANQTQGKESKPPYQIKEKNIAEKMFIGTGGITNYSFINYIPQLIGIQIGKLFQKNYVWQYYSARVFNLIFYIFIVFFALKIFPFSKWGAAILALNPMALFLTSSVSGDGMIIAGSFFFTSWMLKLISEAKITDRQMLVSALMMVSLVLMKPTLIVLGILFFLIPNKTLDLKRKGIWGIGIFLISILLYVSWNKLMIDQQLLYRDFANPEAQVKAFLNNPQIFFVNFFENYLFGIKGDGMIYSFVGNFGWLDTPLGWHWVIIYFISLTIGCLVQQEGDHSLLILHRVLMILGIVAYIFLTFFALYQIWNKVNRKSSIEGVQGRYFIPGSLLIVPLFSSKEKILSLSNKKINMILSLCMLTVLLATMITLNNRYI
ncbi:DUF2142 domain-containing protein [Enterococcus avium]|uniref:DUF2142 domain-containing protein n=1 Tax=Enterococcus avium TaxID=33945 RepID=UPI003D6A5247